MVRNYFHFFLGLFPLLLLSCEEPLELEIEEDARLVVISQFTQEKDLNVYVSKTQTIQDTKKAGPVTNATVMLFAGNELIEILELAPGVDHDGVNPYYKSKVLIPLIGETYTIKVNAPGFKSVTATNSIPASVPIKSVDFTPNIKVGNANDLVIDFEIAVTFSDPLQVENFYHLAFYQELQNYQLGPDGDTTFYPGITLIRPGRIDLDDTNQPLIKHFDNGSFLIKDATFNGDEVTFHLNGTYAFDPSKYVPGNFLVELRTVSEAYYSYHLAITRQTNPKGNPIDNGVYVDDNIENGEGIFAGYSSSFNSSALGD